MKTLLQIRSSIFPDGARRSRSESATISRATASGSDAVIPMRGELVEQFAVWFAFSLWFAYYLFEVAL
ncbi:MAG: hypothetical protein JOZ85_14360 [Betaproteobacteria bacterium]|nr:hypothetical protein [Betaproteobacteria bacterium]